nr:aldehyde dehydrogenase family 2 member B4, mitochondrial-like [Tanacetum cinerariifolium]
MTPCRHCPSFHLCCRLEILTWSSGSPVPSYVFTLLGIRVLRELSKLWIQGVNESSFSHIHGLVKSSSFVDLCLFNLDLWYLPLLESLFDPLYSGDSLSLLLFIWRERFLSQYEWEKESSYESPTLRKRSLSFVRSSLEVSNLWGRLLPRGWSLESVPRGLDLVVLGDLIVGADPTIGLQRESKNMPFRVNVAATDTYRLPLPAIRLMNDEEVKLHSEGYGAVYVKKTRGYVVCAEAGHNKTGIATLIAKKAIAKNTGVRGLRVILENVLMDTMFKTLNDIVLGVTQVGLPPGVLNIASGFGPTSGAALASHMDV